MRTINKQHTPLIFKRFYSILTDIFLFGIGIYIGLKLAYGSFLKYSEASPLLFKNEGQLPTIWLCYFPAAKARKMRFSIKKYKEKRSRSVGWTMIDSLIEVLSSITVYIQEVILSIVVWIIQLPKSANVFTFLLAYLVIISYFILLGILIKKLFKERKIIIFSILLVMFLWQFTALIMLIIGITRMAQ